MKTDRITDLKLICAFLLLVMVGVFCVSKAFAADTKKNPPRRIFEADESGNYYSGSSIDSFAYGRPSMGELAIYGDIPSEDTYQGYTSYAAKGEITIRYSYDGAFQTDKKEDWNLISDKSKKVNGIELSKKIALGTVIVQKSTDNQTWKNAQDPLTDYFDENKGLRDICTISETDLKKGTFYRIIIAYKMGRKTGSSGVFDIVDEYEYKLCTEVYEFYAYYGGNPIILRDIISRSDISNSDASQSGFIIDKNSSSDTVTLTKGSTKIDVTNFMSVYEPGDYTVNIESSVGDEYQYNIQVSDGLEMCDVAPTVYENKKKDDYAMVGSISGNTAFGQPSYTTLRIGQGHGNKITESSYKGFNAYGISGDRVSIFMELTKEKTLKDAGWTIETDDYGKKEKETIAGVSVGQVASGALIIQTSSDGVNWTSVDKAKYTNGLYTTDYNKNYSSKGNVCIYTPDGQELIKGLYVRVLYVYMAYQKSSKTTNRYVEEYDMYLCSSELDAVTFHNLSIGDKLTDSFGDLDETTVSMYKHAETIQSGKGTVTGFEIDTTLNPTVKYTVEKDGKDVTIPENHKFTENGRYTINLNSAVGDKKTVTIYVDKSSDQEALDNYFRDFIDGKRIFDEDSKYPVYEGGETTYTIKGISESYLPVSGIIKNNTTGKTTTISASRSERKGDLTEPGEYEATFTTNSSFDQDVTSGDCRTFTFRFKIIANGTAPGPKVNQESLKNYAATSVSDAYPMFYALTYQSAGKGYITMVFSTKEAAVDFAYNYEKGMVEKTSDGSFKYNGSFMVSEKEEYNDNWELTDAINHFAEMAVHEQYIDLSDVDSYITLDQKDIDDTKNLRTLELSRSIVVYANDDEKANLTSLRSNPIIAEKPHAYLGKGLNGVVKEGTDDFEFVKDKYGCDSNSVKITDKNNTIYTIQYNEGVAKQLKAKNCPSGKITISESTIYGDKAEYDAIYIAPGENTASVKIAYYEYGEEKELTLTQEDNGKVIEADAFSILDVNDELDPYQLVSVSSTNQDTYRFVSNQDTVKSWTEKDNYTIKVVNQVGNEIAFNINVGDSNYSTITFRGEGTENAKDILAKQGDKNVSLPELTRYGYEFEGYKDSNDNLYTSIMKVVPDFNTIILEPVWKAKECTVTFLNNLSEVYQTETAEYNSRIELPTIDLGAGLRFVGWSLNNEPVDTDTILITSEDMVLEPIVEEVSVEEASVTDAVPAVNNNKKGHGFIWIIIAVLGVGACGFGVLKKKGVIGFKRD